MAPIIEVSNAEYRALRELGLKAKLVEPRKADLVVPTQDFWTIPNIHYRGEIVPADLSKRLLPVRTQQQHAEHRNFASPEDFVTMDMPFYIAMFDALFKQRDTLEYAGDVRNFVQRSMRQSFPITLTRIAYSPRGKDTVTHNYGTEDSYQVRANIVGEDRVIRRWDREAIEAVTGTRDIKRLHQIFNYLNGTDLSVYRFNEKPQELTECVARLYAGADDAGASCYRHPGDVNASLGVRVGARSAKFLKG